MVSRRGYPSSQEPPNTTQYSPLEVVGGGPGPPQRLGGEVRDPGQEPEADQVEQGGHEQGLAVGVDGVLEDPEFGGVAQDPVEDVGRVTVGGREDLRAVRAELVGESRVAGETPIEEVARQGPGGERLAALGEPEAVG